MYKRQSLEHPKYNEGFIAFVEDTYDVLESHYIAGDSDYLIKVVTDTTTTLERLLRDIKCIPGVARTCTSMVLSTVKNEHSINPHSIRSVSYTHLDVYKRQIENSAKEKIA